MKLSNDYSPFGSFATQIWVISLILIVLGAIPMFVFGIGYGLIWMIVPTVFVIWGMRKQTRELGY